MRKSKDDCGFDPAKLGIFLRGRFPRDTAKKVSLALSVPGVLDISPRTVENWLAGHASPGFRAVGRMIEVWEADFLHAVMARPARWARDAKAAREFVELERQRSELARQLLETFLHV